MKYFTREWWAGDAPNIEATRESYWSYVASIRDRLPPDVAMLAEKVSLHDSKVREFSVSIAEKQVVLLLDGYADPWTPAGSDIARKISLLYQDVVSVHSTNDFSWGNDVAEHLDSSDLGYQEIELLPDGLIEHRMLFASGIELIVRFKSLRLTYEDSAQPSAGGNAAAPRASA